MRKKIRIFSLLVGLSTGVFAQIGGEYDPYLINPSLGGSKEMVTIGTLYQTEMSAYDYHPKSFLLWGTSPFSNQRVAGGFKVSSVEAGVLRNVSAEATFIYYVDVADSRLSFGLSAGINQLQLMRNRVEVRDLSDPILQGAETGNWFNANLGVAISKSNIYYVGLATYNLLPKQTNWMVSDFENKTEILYALAGMYTFDFDVVKLECSTLLSTSRPDDFSWLHYGVSTKLLFGKDFWIGTGYESQSIIKGSFGINIQNLSFGYTGNYCFAKTYNYAFNKHEIVLILKLPYSKTSKTTGA